MAKPKQRFSDEVVDFLNKVFKINRNPNLGERTKLAPYVSLSEKQIQMWFFNKRLKTPLNSELEDKE